MEKYDYRSAVAADVRRFIDDEICMNEFANKEQLSDYLNDTLFLDDSVTGNASGSYFCNAWRAAECLFMNWDLLLDAMNDFCSDCNPIEKGEEWCDVMIRCYLLGEAIVEVLDEMEACGKLLLGGDDYE